MTFAMFNGDIPWKMDSNYDERCVYVVDQEITDFSTTTEPQTKEICVSGNCKLQVTVNGVTTYGAVNFKKTDKNTYSVDATQNNQKSTGNALYVAGLKPATVQSVGVKNNLGTISWLNNIGDSVTLTGQPVISFPDGLRVSTAQANINKLNAGVPESSTEYGLLAATTKPTSTTDPFWQLADQESTPPGWYSGSLPDNQSYIWRDGDSFRQILYSTQSPGFKTHTWLTRAPTHEIRVRLN